MKQKFRAVFLAALALPVALLARVVTSSEAASVARAWASEGVRMGASVGTRVAAVSSEFTTNGAPFFAVRMEDGGLVVTSGDTAMEPIVAFSPEDADLGVALSKSGPLWALLNRDISSRTPARALKVPARGGAQLLAASASANAAASAEEELTEAEKANAAEWSRLLAAANRKGPQLLGRSSLGDVVVAPLVQSAWDQATVGSLGRACYNYFTPDTGIPHEGGSYTTTGSVENAVCGCVATAMSQIMRYHQFPTEENTNHYTKTCVFTDSAGTPYEIKLAMQCGVYDWDAMPYVPGDGSSVSQLMAIGKLTSDAGISVEMMYSKEGSGTYNLLVPGALRKNFGYASAFVVDGAGTNLPPASLLGRTLLANFDAGFPTLLGVSGAGGHAIVGDGYGYEGGKTWIHLNMGWSGSYNLWYVLPDVKTGHVFTSWDDVVYNVFPVQTNAAIVSGRVYDPDGNVAAGAKVELMNAADVVVAETNTTASGTYAFLVSPNSYWLRMTAAGGLQAARVDCGTVTAPFGDTVTAGLADHPFKTSVSASHYVNSEGRAGNWRGETQLKWADVVRMNSPASPVFYPSIAEAVANANDGDVLYVTRAASVDGVVTVTNAITLTTTNVALKVLCTEAGALAVATNGMLTLKEIHFTAVPPAAVEERSEEDPLQEIDRASALVTVASNGHVRVMNDVRMPGGVSAERNDGFVLAGGLTEGICVTCRGGMSLGAQVGVVDVGVSAGDFSTANRVLHPTDEELVGKVFEAEAVEVDFGGATKTCHPIKWDDGEEVADGDAVVRINGRNRRGLNAALRHAAGDSTIEILTNCTLSTSMTISHAMTFRGIGLGARGKRLEISVAPGAGFKVVEGGSVWVENVRFHGGNSGNNVVWMDDCLFRVEGGALTLGANAELVYLAGTNGYSGAVALFGGKVDVAGAGALIQHCSAERSNEQYDTAGGGIYVVGGVCTVTNGQIRNCKASWLGGGVAVASPGELRVGGNAFISNNTRGDTGNRFSSDVEIYNDKYEQLQICSALTTSAKVGVCMTESRLNAAGTDEKPNRFAKLADGLSATIGSLACARLFNSQNSALVVKFNETDGTFSWVAPAAPSATCPEGVAVVKVEYGDGSDAEFYPSLETALENLRAAATITVLRSPCELLADVSVRQPVKLVGADDDFTLTRGKESPTSSDGRSVFTVTVAPEGSLEITNLTVDASRDENYWSAPEFFRVNGALTLAPGAKIRNVWGNLSRASCAVAVEGGTFTMEIGSGIHNCINDYCEEVQRTTAGAVLVGGAGTFRFLGGEISGCRAQACGGVAVENESTLYLSGTAKIAGNFTLGGAEANLTVSDDSEVVLDGVLDAATLVGVMPRIDSAWKGALSNRVARVREGLLVVDDEDACRMLAQSAACFRRDGDGVRAALATNETGAAFVVFTNGVTAADYESGAYPYFPLQVAVTISAAGVWPENVPAPTIGGFDRTPTETPGVVKLGLTIPNAAPYYYSVWRSSSPVDGFEYVPKSEKLGTKGADLKLEFDCSENLTDPVFIQIRVDTDPKEK